MSSHFLLSAKARTLSLSAVLRMGDEEAEAAFVRIRWHAASGKGVIEVVESLSREKLVFVREYQRFRLNRWECVSAHYRSLPR